ncbi:BRISC and BRCA1-A complex member 1-like [Neocloeon triangulifer]|uniref:BRISC and BRCA1-A complex member 1-like n=1 Tax=Neocloeon triangulifer TaxID=2078957 RepID=UPI00286F4A35|nr:BRISC and BRCA1-A complex member 1-like [Neocloeon triangulifer]
MDDDVVGGSSEMIKNTPAGKQSIANNDTLEFGLNDNSQGNDNEPEEELNKTLSDTNKTLRLPSVNVPERIIICLDICADSNGDPFRFCDGTKQSPLNMVKMVVQMFMFCKMTVNSKHQYALMVLHEDGASWLLDFTFSPTDIANTMATLKTREQPPEWNLTSMFNIVNEKVLMPHVADIGNDIPPYIYRVICIYARTNCRPTLEPSSSATALMKSPYFFLDLIYVHEPLNEQTKETCQSIFNDLCADLSLPTSYVFNVARNPTKLHDCMAKLLAHPLQRPLQEDTEYKLMLPE